MEETRVWISRLGTSRHDVEGTLTLTPSHLDFHHRRGAEHEHIPLAAVRKVRRPIGSAVLEVEYLRDGEPVHVAFFFIQPPPPVAGEPRIHRHRQQRQNIEFMVHEAGAVKARVKRWRDDLRDAVRRARVGE